MTTEQRNAIDDLLDCSRLWDDDTSFARRDIAIVKTAIRAALAELDAKADELRLLRPLARCSVVPCVVCCERRDEWEAKYGKGAKP